MSATAGKPMLYCAAVPWTAYSTATPLADFRAAALLGRGTPYRHDQTARAYLSRWTFDVMTCNTNNADLYGRRHQTWSHLAFRDEVDFLFRGDGLPSLYVAGEGEGLPDGLVVVVPLMAEAGADPFAPFSVHASAADFRAGEGHRYGLRPAGDAPPGVVHMEVGPAPSRLPQRTVLAFERDPNAAGVYHDWCLDNGWPEMAAELERRTAANGATPPRVLAPLEASEGQPSWARMKFP